MSERIVSVGAGVSLGLALLLRSVARTPVFEGTSETVEPWLVSAVPHWSHWLVAIALGGLTGYVLPRKLAFPFLLGGLSAAVLVPPVFRVAPFVAAFSGRFLDFVLATCAVYAAITHVRLRGTWTTLRVGLLSLVVLLAASFKMHRDVGFSGDEPHYLLMTHSLVEDGDLKVRNNYFQEDYRAFYGGKIGPRLASDTPYSVHGIGLPLLLAPGYAVFGAAGAVVTLALLGAVLTAGIFRITRALTASDGASLLASASFVLTSPALFLSVSAYPELPAALIVVAVATLFVSGGSRPGGWAALIGTLPFFHIKFLPLAGVLWASLFYRGTTRAERTVVVVTALGGLAALLGFFYVTTGSPDPTASYGRQRIFASGIPTGLLGLLFDQEFGLLVNAPIYVASICGLVALFRERALLAVGALCVFGAVALPGAAHPLWSGGSSPPARFLFPGLPLLAVALGCLWSSEKAWGVTRWTPALFAMSVTMASFALTLSGQPLYLNARDGSGQLWEALSSSWDLTAYLPSIVTGDARSLMVAVLGVAVLAMAVGVHIRKRRVPLPALAVVLLLAAWIQDVTGVSHPRTQEGRWITAFMREVADDDPKHFVALPGFERLDRDGLAARVSLRLRPLRPDGDPRFWWSLPYAIPAGRYRVSGIRVDGWAPCHDFRCFDVIGERFESTVAFSRFRVRALRLENPPPRLHFETVRGGRPVATRSRPVTDERRLHSLDDRAYPDRRGFWVRARARAAFVLEPGGELFLTNGGMANTAVVHTAGGEERFELEPYARIRIELPTATDPMPFWIESVSGFRPSALDPASADHRELGLHVGAPRF